VGCKSKGKEGGGYIDGSSYVVVGMEDGAFTSQGVRDIIATMTSRSQGSTSSNTKNISNKGHRHVYEWQNYCGRP
jgi:hypothetical protein